MDKCTKCGSTKDLYVYTYGIIKKMTDIVCGHCAKQLALDKSKLTKKKD